MKSQAAGAAVACVFSLAHSSPLCITAARDRSVPALIHTHSLSCGLDNNRAQENKRAVSPGNYAEVNKQKREREREQMGSHIASRVLTLLLRKQGGGCTEGRHSAGQSTKSNYGRCQPRTVDRKLLRLWCGKQRVRELLGKPDKPSALQSLHALKDPPASSCLETKSMQAQWDFIISTGAQPQIIHISLQYSVGAQTKLLHLWTMKKKIFTCIYSYFLLLQCKTTNHEAQSLNILIRSCRIKATPFYDANGLMHSSRQPPAR